MDKLFTYGTLRPSLYAHKVGDVVGTPAKLTGFKMFNLGRFPCLVEDDSDGLEPIVGETIAIPSVTMYDGYEGYPILYNRKEVACHVDKEHDYYIGCWVYFMEPQMFSQHEARAIYIPSGDWADVLAKKAQL